MRDRMVVLIICSFLLDCDGRERRLLVSPTEPSQPKTAQLHGTVKTEANEPLSSASVTITYPDDSRLSTQTDSRGVYRFEGLVPQSCGIVVRSADRQLRASSALRLFPGMNHRDLVAVADDSCIRPFGLVRDANSRKPISEATVEYFHRSTRTASDGTFKLDFGCERIHGSTAVFRVTHPSYEEYQTLTRAMSICTCGWDVLLVPKDVAFFD